MKVFSKITKLNSYPYSTHIAIALLVLILIMLKVSPALALLIGGSIFGTKFLIQKYRKKQYREKLTEQIPDTIEALANAMKAGYSFEQALEFITRESREPLKESLEYAIEKMNYSFTTKAALESLQKRANHKDIDLIVNGILMQYQIGGNIIEMLENSSALMRERLKLQNELKAFTAQGRFSGILIALLCPISVVMFYIISPEYIGILFHTTPGQFFLILAAILEIIGFKLIWNITHLTI